MSARLSTLFANVGAECASDGQLDEAFAELADTVPVEVITEALCSALPDTFGYCSDCGARLRAKPHKKGGNSIGCGFAAPLMVGAALRALWRRLLVRVHSQATVARLGDRVGASPSLPRIRRYRGTGTTTHEEVR